MIIEVIRDMAVRIYMNEKKKSAKSNLEDIKIILSEIQTKMKENSR